MDRSGKPGAVQGDDVLCFDNYYAGRQDNIAHLLADVHFEAMRHDITFPLFVGVDEIYDLACPASPVCASRTLFRVAATIQPLLIVCYALESSLADGSADKHPGHDVRDPNMDEFITTISETTSNPLVAKVATALQRAIASDGKLPPEVLAIQGMSGRKYRLFINNLIGSIDDACYLEVGVWAGSTLCSAIHGNKVRAVAIDNWSQFGGPASEFLVNLSRFKTAEARVSFLESDFRAVDFGSLGRFNVYLFDGPHAFKDQHDGVIMALPALDNYCVLIVDDWNWPEVRRGTMTAVRAAGMTVDYLAEIRTSMDDKHALVSGAQSDWHNGYFIAALSKAAPQA